MTSTLSDLPLFVIAARDKGMAQVERNAGSAFKCAALKFVVAHLREHGEVSGEAITTAAKAAGIIPHDDRAFGPVFKMLLHDKSIERVGECARIFGHGSRGGSIYKAASV